MKTGAGERPVGRLSEMRCGGKFRVPRPTNGSSTQRMPSRKAGGRPRSRATKAKRPPPREDALLGTWRLRRWAALFVWLPPSASAHAETKPPRCVLCCAAGPRGPGGAHGRGGPLPRQGPRSGGQPAQRRRPAHAPGASTDSNVFVACSVLAWMFSHALTAPSALPLSDSLLPIFVARRN
jgi:hypothetical protein